MTTAHTPTPQRTRIAGLLAIILGALLLTVLPAGAAHAQADEAMQSFEVTYDLRRDGSVAVTERIVWRFPAGEERRGIFRNIVVRMGWNDEENRYRYYELSDVQVDSPSGAPDVFRVSDQGASKQIRIGRSDLYTSGTQTYVISYTLANVLNPIEGTDGGPDTVEFHYNVFGSNERTQRDRVNVTVNAPAPSTDVRCFRGERGSTDQCTATQGDPTRFSATDLGPGLAMTVLAQYPATAFDDPRPDVRSGRSDTGYGAAAAPFANAAAYATGIGAPILAAAVMGALVWTRGRDERYADVTPGLTPVPGMAAGPGGNGGAAGPAAEPTPALHTTRGGPDVVAVQFHPPAGVQPGLVGTIIDETANPIDVSATVIDLAVRGFLRIEERESGGMFTRTDWTLTRLAPQAGERLHPYESRLLEGIFSGRGGSVDLSDLKNHFASTLKKVQSDMYDEVVQRGWFRSSPQTQRGVWQGLGVVLAVVGGLVLFYGQGFLRAVLGNVFTGGTVLGIGLILAGGITWVLGGKMAAKTGEGSAVLAQSLGFKEYLLTAEADQIAFDEASNIFSRYLPYAVVFGVADRWAHTFADVARAAEAANQPLIMPAWYVWHGAMMPDFTSIADGVDSFSTTSTGTFTSTPGSSGNSGFSGGGGFSGSGGGGSSSGSW